MKRTALSFAALALAAAPAVAQDADEDTDGWTGEGSLSAGLTTGNTDTVDIGIGINIARTAGPWKYTAEGGYDYGELDNVEARNRWFVAGQVDREITDRLYSFGRASYEQDEFSGFDSRLFLGIGAGYHVFKGERLRWSVEGAPGFRIDEVSDTIDPGPPETIVPGDTVENFALRGSSRFAYDFNENVGFTNDTDVIWTDLSTQTINTSALNAKLTEALTARLSFEVRNDTNPPAGFVNTDTATRLAIVYGF